MKWVCLSARVPRALELMMKTFPTLAFAFSLVANEDEIYPLLLGGSTVTMAVDACVDDATSGNTCELHDTGGVK